MNVQPNTGLNIAADGLLYNGNTNTGYNLNNIANQQEQIDEIKQNIEIIETEIINLENDIILIEENITNIESDIVDINSSIATIQNNIVTINGKINTLTSQVTTIQNNITTINSQISSLSTRVTTAENNINTINSSLISLTNRITTAENNISTINGKINTLTFRVDTLEVTTEGLANRMTAAENKITALEAEIVEPHIPAYVALIDSSNLPSAGGNINFKSFNPSTVKPGNMSFSSPDTFNFLTLGQYMIIYINPTPQSSGHEIRFRITYPNTSVGYSALMGDAVFLINVDVVPIKVQVVSINGLTAAMAGGTIGFIKLYSYKN